MERRNNIMPEDKVNRRTFLRRLVGLSGKGEDASLVDTAKLSFSLTLAMLASSPFARDLKDSTGINLGNAIVDMPDYIQWEKENPIPTLLLGSVAAPVYEEGIFRILPNICLGVLSKTGTMWKVGLPSSVVFAGIHGLALDYSEADEINKQPKLRFASVPLYQFGAGIFLWKIVRERGYLHAIVAHSVVNTTLSVIDFLFPSSPFGKYPPNPK